MKKTRKSLRTKGKEIKKEVNEDEIDNSKPWQCVICSTEEKSKTFQDINDLVYHHMSHSILDLAQALADIQKLLKNVRFFDKFLNLKNETQKDDTTETEDVVPPDESNEEIIEEPIKKPSKQKKFQCEVCHKVLSSRGNLNKHLVIHDDSKKFKC